MTGPRLKLHVERAHTCPCGTIFKSRNPSARYHSNECRKRFGRFGMTYGQTEPRALGWTR